MRFYPVPHSTKEETKIVFGLSGREFSLLLSGLIAGIILAGLVSLLAGVFIVFTMAVFLPLTLGAAAYMAFKRVKEIDTAETLDRHYLKSLRYRFRVHDYVNYRRPGYRCVGETGPIRVKKNAKEVSKPSKE